MEGEQTFNHAGFGRRLTAGIIDAFVIGIPLFLLCSFLEIVTPDILILSLVAMLGYVTVSTIFTLSSRHASLGKRLTNTFISHKFLEVDFKIAFVRSLFIPLIIFALFNIGLFIANKAITSPKMFSGYEALEQELYKNIPEAESIIKNNGLSVLQLPKFSKDDERFSKAFSELNKAVSNKGMTDQKNAFLPLQKIAKLQQQAKEIYLQITAAIILLVLFAWYLPVFLSSERVATHDIILNTRVLMGKPEDYYNYDEAEEPVTKKITEEDLENEQ